VAPSLSAAPSWGEIFGDDVAATAMIDRLVHHAEVLALKGDSYRLRQRRRRPVRRQTRRDRLSEDTSGMPAVVSLVLAISCAAMSGCSNAPDTFAITFINDTGQDAVLNLCDDHACHHYDYSDKLPAGRPQPENISTDNVFTRWAVTDNSGRRIGCLPFNFAGAYSNAVARLSQMVPCPGKRPLPLTSGTPEHN
jgi:hypothetical protein